MTLNFIGKSVAYMPYAEVKRAIEQEAQVQNTAARSASPYRLSPREVNKASPQPDMNAARYSVPPGKYCLFCTMVIGCLPSEARLPWLTVVLNCSLESSLH